MKLSFSTNGWKDRGWDETCRVAKELGFAGIELHSIGDPIFTRRDGAFNGPRARASARSLREEGLCVPCLDTVSDPSRSDGLERAEEEMRSCIAIAEELGIPFVRIRAADGNGSPEAASAAVAACLSAVIGDAEEAGVVLLIETVGIYADTGRLRDLLNSFSSDCLGALWDLYATCFAGGEDAETTITNLGAWVRHVHIKDAKKSAEGPQHCLIGDGDLPVGDFMNALRSVNYDGFISLEWDPAWMPELDDMEIIFAHFANFMRRFDDPSLSKSPLYSNRAHTGWYVWKKEQLIDCTFGQVLDRMVEEFPDQYAFRYTTLDYTRTYAEFRDDVDEFAKSLVALGIRAGSHIAMWATNVPQWYITFWAAVRIGAVLVTMNTAYKIHEAEYLLRQSDANMLVMVQGYKDTDYAAILRELCPELDRTADGEPLHSRRLPFLRHVITAGFSMPGALRWEAALERGRKVPIEEVHRMAAAVSKRDACNMQYTSGTTGFPKGVMLTHYNVVNNGKCIGDRMDLSTADRMMIQVPMFHCFGMVLAMTACMTHGVTMLPLPYFSPKPALACIHSEHVTAFHGVPTMFIAMLEHPDFPKTDFSHMRTGIMAGSPCPISVMKEVVDRMHMSEITIVYGQTEASPGCTMSSTDDPLEVRVNTVGHNLPEIECRIVDPETGAPCPDGVTGEFVARGYNIMKGYYKMPRATASAIDRDGWLHTGDLACRTPEGNYRITGRLKDMIIRGGENIYPKEIEEFIYTNPKVRDVQVIGVPDETYGEEIMACVILREGASMTEKELKEFVGESMARHKVPRYVEFTDEFPTNAAGKILKYKMREAAIRKLGLQKANGIVTA